MTDVYTLDDDGSVAPFIRKNGKMWSLAGTAFDHAAAVHTVDALNAYEKEDVSAAVETVRPTTEPISARLEDIEAELTKIKDRLKPTEAWVGNIPQMRHDIKSDDQRLIDVMGRVALNEKDIENTEGKLDSICAGLAKVYERLYALENPNPCKTREQVEAQ